MEEGSGWVLIWSALELLLVLGLRRKFQPEAELSAVHSTTT